MGRRGRKAALAGVTLGSVGLSLFVAPGTASAAPLPQLPDNVVIFPDRDFITAEGFEGLTNATARVQVLRGAGETVVGQTDAEVNYPEAGVAFEVNHPGGACWGQGAPAGLNVTPDIKGNDVLRLTIDGVTYDTPVAPISVASESASGATVTVISNVPSSIPDDRIEARIIEPALKDTAVGRRDARATFGGTGDDGYTSSLQRVGETVVARYTFESAAVAQTALGGTSRIMSWVTAQGEERAGITIAEHNEHGGPGMGGCPAGPADVAQPAPGNATFQRSVDRTSMQVRWTPADTVAGGTAVSGYQVTVTDTAGNLRGKNVLADVTTATLTGLDPAATYTVQVRAAQGEVLSKPFTAGESTGQPAPGSPPADTVKPALAAASFDSATNLLTLSATDNAGTPQIYYTLDGTLANDADVPALNAALYKAPIAITGTVPVTVNYAAFDAAGNVDTGKTTVTPGAVTPAAPLAAPTGLVATSVSDGIKVDWNAVTGATDYEVTVLDAAGTAVVKPAALTSGARTTTITGLDATKTYTISVKGVATGRTAQAATVRDAKPGAFVSTPVVARANWKARDFRVEGTSNAASGQIRIYRANAQGQLLTSTGAVTTDLTRAQQYGNGVALTAAVAPETGTTFILRLRDGQAPATNPGFVVAIASPDGGRSPATAVANR